MTPVLRPASERLEIVNPATPILKPKLLIVELWGVGNLVIATSFLRAAAEQFERHAASPAVCARFAAPILARGESGAVYRALDRLSTQVSPLALAVARPFSPAAGVQVATFRSVRFFPVGPARSFVDGFSGDEKPPRLPAIGKSETFNPEADAAGTWIASL